MPSDVILGKAFEEAGDLVRWVVEARPTQPTTRLQRMADESEAVLGNAVAALASLVVMVYVAVLGWTALNAVAAGVPRQLFAQVGFHMKLIAAGSAVVGILLGMQWMLRVAVWAKSYRLPQIVSLSATIIVLGRALASVFSTSDPWGALGAAFLGIFAG